VLAAARRTTSLWLRVRDPRALGLRRVAWKWVLISIGAGVGVVAALLLRRTGSVWPGVIVHAINNAYSLVVPAILGAAS
jgi:membrane protease YdiL (CAAX protease family)